ncbi:MAG: peptidoglycan-binding domain-containing protein [Paracoccaceae bacterium]|nr:peptidoglycan-binding domain-containing protein [Paracoccaceae bacterium]
MRLIAYAIALSIVLIAPAGAQSIGLLVGISDYDALPDVDRGERILTAADSLERAGVDVTELREPDSDQLSEAFAQLEQMAPKADRLIVALSGRFLSTPTDTYFVPRGTPTTSIASLDRNALSISSVLAVLSQAPGKAVLVITSRGETPSFGPLIGASKWDFDIPQGVTVIIGKPRAATKAVTDHVAQPGRPFVGASRRLGLVVDGFAPDTLVFTPGNTAPPQTRDNRIEDIRDWRIASNTNTARAYQDYVKKHPQGEFVAMAENRIRALTDTPEARAERTEQALDLSRDARRDIQRDLSLLGFNTRGIDGIFGRATRAAVANWQERERFDVTGYLTREQIALLDEQAERRAAELEAEAERRREEQLASDLEYWDQTGAVGDEAGLRAYLKRFPDGNFAELANERLAIIEERKRNRASRIDQQLWDEAKQQDTAQAYEDYLVSSPNGAFREEAQARIVALQRDARFADAARAEEAMGLSPRTKQVVEARLKGLGLRPGPVDGVFDEDTRRALRRYQAARKMPETGYMSDQVMVQLMADTVRQIFR